MRSYCLFCFVLFGIVAAIYSNLGAILTDAWPIHTRLLPLVQLLFLQARQQPNREDSGRQEWKVVSKQVCECMNFGKDFISKLASDSHYFCISKIFSKAITVNHLSVCLFDQSLNTVCVELSFLVCFKVLCDKNLFWKSCQQEKISKSTLTLNCLGFSYLL